MEKGRIVCSKAGSDKNTFMVVVGEIGNAVLLSDGKRYKLASPKKKNPKHIAPTGEILNMNQISTDKALRTALAVYRSKL
jgi:ribosomal protein L14E/L6E/L27E